MTIAVSSTGKTLDSQMDLRFGRAACFVFVDADTLAFEALDNAALAASGGAGISAAQAVADRGVSVVITGNVGPNAMRVLTAAGIAIVRGEAITVRENVARYLAGSLAAIDETVPPHSGMGGGGRG